MVNYNKRNVIILEKKFIIVITLELMMEKIRTLQIILKEILKKGHDESIT